MRGLAMLFHPLAMNSFRHWACLLRDGNGLDNLNCLRAAVITLACPFWAPVRMAERVFYNRRVARERITEPPIFILGHWRTGTTMLHYLMAQDPLAGSVSLFQTLIPESFLVGRRLLRPLMKRFVPATRPMDNMPLGLDLPQEEEYALCNMTPHSFYVGWYFPHRMPELFRRYVLFDDAPPDVVSEWKSAYLGVLKKASVHCGGKRLVLKNPVNMGRLRLVLELFPNAKFIHVYRNPFVVYKSTQRLYRAAIDVVGLQKIDDETIKENVLSFYEQMMRRYMIDRALIPPENLVEVRYEDLEQKPLEELERLYAALGLPGWGAAQPRAEDYVKSQEGYAKNEFEIGDNDIAQVRERWGFALDEWGYSGPP
jgi:hypothetical protein